MLAACFSQHTYTGLGRPLEAVTDIVKKPAFRLYLYQPAENSFFALAEQLRQDRVVP
jgi:hypothetical protein